MFGRRKTAEPPAPTITVQERPGAKNRPTPRRREAEAARRKPLVPTDRKAAAKAEKDQNRLQRARQREALVTGQESLLPARDRGPQKRFVRDVVDARWNIGEWYLLLALVAVALVLVPSMIGMDPMEVAQVQLVSTLVLWGTVLLCGADAYLLSRLLRRKLPERFGEDVVPRGVVSYGILRSFQIRKWRLPKPQVDRGEKPR